MTRYFFGKQEKKPGKDLSENDFTNEYKKKLDELKNYDDTKIKKDISDIQKEQTTQNTNIQTNTESIAQIKEKDTTQDKLIEQLQAENTKLKKEINSMQIPGEATGNPIHLSDSSDMECEIVPIGGAEQETREGYNKLPYPYQHTTRTTNGITFTDNGDGTVTANGTATAHAYFNLSFPTLKAGTYTVSGVPEGARTSADSTLNFMMKFGTVNYEANGTFTTTEEFTPTESYIRVSSGVTVNNLVFKPMVYEGTEEKPYEQYGAMPSPNYPSKVVTVGQNVNMFDKDNANKINGWIDNSGYFQYSSDFKVLYIQCDRNKDYTVSSKYLRGIAFLNEVAKTGLTSTNFKIQNATELTLNSQDNTYLAVWYYATASGLTEQEILDSIKIVEGTEVGAYSPYGQGSVEIEVVNKNYLNFLDKSGNLSGLDYSCNKNIINLNGTPSTSYDIRNIIETIKLKAGTYTFSANIGKFSISNSCQFHFRDKYNNAIVTLNLWGTGYKKTVTFEDDIEIDGNRSYFYTNKNVVFSQDKFVLQIEPGTVATEPVEHESYTKVLPIQKEFVKIGDYEDTFVKQDGKWYEKHCISKEKFNGAENWENQWSGDRFAWRLTLDNIKTTGSADDKGFVISNYFKLYTQNELYQKSEHYGICNRTNQEQIIIKNDDTTSTADFKAYFAEKYANGTPVIVYYVLETPELIECTAEQESILNSFYTHKGVTNISMSGIGTLKVNYKKDLETIINNLATATVALGGNLNV